jgi:hypothetical protein
VDEGRIGTIVEIHKGGMEVIVEWDPLPETAPETPRTPPPFKEEETQTEKSALKEIADKKAAEAAETAKKKAEQEGAQARDENEDDEHKFVDSAMDEIVLMEFPASTPGALPTGLGSKGRVGEGKAVYALALHSKAVSMTSIPVYTAAACTELSPSGSGGWFPITRINEHDGPGRGSPKAASRSTSKQGSQAPSATQSKANSKVPSRAQSPLEGTRRHSATGDARGKTPEGQGKSPPCSPGRTATSDLQAHDHEDLAYSGQVRVQCIWVKFPEIWEWKACGTDTRHRDEVSGLAFSWRVSSGSESNVWEMDAPELSLTSCSLDGQIKNWRWSWSSTLAEDAGHTFSKFSI